MIIGITGTQASGKGTVVNELKKHGFTHYSARDYLTTKVLEKKLSLERQNYRITADELRKKYGPEYVIKSLFLQAKKHGGNAVIESVRTIGEVLFLQKQTDFLLLSVNADIHIRYKRAIKRNSDLDHIRYDEFVKLENAELANDEPHKINLVKCSQMADIHIINNGSKKELTKQILSLLNNKL